MIVKAYRQGVEAAKDGWDRISPYKNCKAETEWYAGYDLVDKIEARVNFKGQKNDKT